MSSEKAVVKTEETKPLAAGVIEQVMLRGDLAKLNDSQRISYYNNLCHSLGLNPLTKPFEYIILNSKLTLYATRAATDQLRSLYKVSIEITKREEDEHFYKVYTKATTADGRTDEALGMVTISGLTGDKKANAYMKAETKAKRRVTLSICGLGFLDESEVETVTDAVDASAFVYTADDMEAGKESPIYFIPFGKFKDKQIPEVGDADLKSYIKYIREKADSQNKEISGVVQDFIDRCEAYFEHKAMDEEFNQIIRD